MFSLLPTIDNSVEKAASHQNFFYQNDEVMKIAKEIKLFSRIGEIV